MIPSPVILPRPTATPSILEGEFVFPELCDITSTLGASTGFGAGVGATTGAGFGAGAGFTTGAGVGAGAFVSFTGTTSKRNDCVGGGTGFGFRNITASAAESAATEMTNPKTAQRANPTADNLLEHL